jgi:hypothetical protein
MRAVEDGAHAAFVAAQRLILQAVAAAAIFLFAPAVSDQRGQRTMAHGRERRLVLKEEIAAP